MPDLIIKPQTNSGDRLRLQDRTGTDVLTTADSGATFSGGNIGTVTAGSIGSAVTGFTGIKEVDMWRLTSSFTNAAAPISSNLARVNDTSTTLLGTGMTESSGNFTFPSTGYWYVYFQASRYVNGNDRSMACKIYVTENNSSYLLATEGVGNVKDFSDNCSSTQSCFKIVDVTSTTNVKVQFHVSCDNTSTGTNGDTDQSRTSMLFMRLGDT